MTRTPKPALLLLSAIVFECTTNWPAVVTDTSVQSIVLPRAPGVKVVPANVTTVGAAVMIRPALVVIIGLERSEGGSPPSIDGVEGSWQCSNTLF